MLTSRQTWQQLRMHDQGLMATELEVAMETVSSVAVAKTAEVKVVRGNKSNGQINNETIASGSYTVAEVAIELVLYCVAVVMNRETFPRIISIICRRRPLYRVL